MIFEYMKNDHRACDEIYSEAENAAAAKDLDTAKAKFMEFYNKTLHHFDMEEKELFITFEKRTGMMGGPTQMMRYEHEQLRGLLNDMKTAIEAGNVDDFFGIGESMMIMLQQHNMKEEQILYPMIDRALGGDAETMIKTLEAMV